MKKIKIIPTRDLVAAELRKAIFNGDFKSGEELVQDTIAKMLGVSRMPVREALQILNNEGLVALIPNRGAFVKQASYDDLHDYFKVRILLESEAVYLACEKMTPEIIRQLTAICDAELISLNEEVIDSCRVLNDQFHSIIWSTAGNRRMESLLHQLWSGKPPMARTNFQQLDAEHAHEGHLAVLKSIKDKDANAARREMIKHIEQALSDCWTGTYLNR